MKRGFVFAVLAVIAAAAGAMVALVTLKNRKMLKEEDDDIELSDSVFFESDGEDFNEANDDHYACDCNDYTDDVEPPSEEASKDE